MLIICHSSLYTAHRWSRQTLSNFLILTTKVCSGWLYQIVFYILCIHKCRCRLAFDLKLWFCDIFTKSKERLLKVGGWRFIGVGAIACARLTVISRKKFVARLVISVDRKVKNNIERFTIQMIIFNNNKGYKISLTNPLYHTTWWSSSLKSYLSPTSTTYTI